MHPFLSSGRSPGCLAWGYRSSPPLTPSGSLSAPNLMSSQPFRNRHFSEPSGAPLVVLLGCGPAQVDCSSEGCSRLQQPLPPCLGLTPVLISVHVLKGQSVPQSILFLMRHLELGVGALKGGNMLPSTSAAPQKGLDSGTEMPTRG